MIVSKKNKIVLITPPKTGTYSITNYLNEFISDKSTPIKKVSYPIYHLTLSEISDVFGINVSDLKNYKIIQCIRNPYTRIVSAYFHQMRLQNIFITFEKFLEKLNETKNLLPHDLDEFYIKFYGNIDYKFNSFNKNNWGGARFYYEQLWFNDLKLDNICYFKLEELSIDASSLSNLVGMNKNKFPHINKNKTPTDYKKLYNYNSKSIVNKLYEKDLNYFKYEF